MGNYTQYFVITYKKKESEKEYIYIYKKLNRYAVHLKLTQDCKSTMFQFKKFFEKRFREATMQRAQETETR